MNKVFLVFILLLTLTLVISACSTATPTTTTPASQPPATSPQTTAPGTTAATTAPVATTPAGTTPASTSPAATTLTPQIGGSLITLVVGSSVNLGNPSLAHSASDITYRLPCVEYMLRMSDTGEYLPELAEKYEIAPDGKSLSLFVRKGVKFHDGSSLNASVAKYSLDMYRTGPNNTLRAVTSIDIIDDYTIKLNMPQWDWGVLNAMTTSTIFSQVALTTKDVEWTKVNPVGTGPYKFANYQRDVSIKYVRNDDYWRGKPYLDSVEFKMMADATSALMAFKAKEGHVFQIQAKDAQDLSKLGYKLTTQLGPTPMYYFPSNNPESPFANLKVRQAVSYAIDRESIAKAEGYGYFQVTYQPWGPDYWAYSNNVEGYPFNPAKAKFLLDQAGYPNGFKTKIYATTISNLGTLVQDYFKKIGITAEMRVVTSAQMTEMSLKGHDDGIAYSPLLYRPTADPSNVMAVNFMTYGQTRVSTQRYPDLEALAEKIASEMDMGKRKALLAEFNKMAVDTYCGWLWVYAPQTIFARDPKVQGLMFDVESATRSYHNAWLMK